jgi:hypothetical protein
MSPRPARLAALALAVAAFGLGSAEPASAAPNITLLSPSNGQTMTIPPNASVTYRWLVNWPDAPPTGTVLIYWQLSSDPSFGPGQLLGNEARSCPAQNYACWTSWAPPRAYGPPWGQTLFWRVSINNVPSAVGSFRVMLARDLVKPRVKALGGTARRGTTARFNARVADNRGLVRFRASLEWRGLPVMARSFPLVQTYWSSPLGFYSARPLPRNMRPGRYQFCITAWDQTGNRARSCAVYRIR